MDLPAKDSTGRLDITGPFLKIGHKVQGFFSKKRRFAGGALSKKTKYHI
jgi:hypothetical protein